MLYNAAGDHKRYEPFLEGPFFFTATGAKVAKKSSWRTLRLRCDRCGPFFAVLFPVADPVCGVYPAQARKVDDGGRGRWQTVRAADS